MSNDLDQYRDELSVQQRASRELGNSVDWNPHLKLPPGIEIMKISKPGVYKLNFFRYPKVIDGGIFTGLKFAAFREYATHQVGPMQTKVLCPYETYGKPCTLCGKKTQAFRDSSLSKDEKKEAARPYFTSKRRMYLVADAEADPQKLWILDIADNCLPEQLDAKIEMVGDQMLGWNSVQHGKTLAIKFDEMPAGEGRRPFRKAVNIEVLPRIGTYTPAFLKKIVDLDAILVPLTDGQIVKMFNEGGDPDDVDTSGEYAEKASDPSEELEDWAEGVAEAAADEAGVEAESEDTAEAEEAPFEDAEESEPEPEPEVKKAPAKKTAGPAKATEPAAKTKAAAKKAPAKEAVPEDDEPWE